MPLPAGLSESGISVSSLFPASHQTNYQLIKAVLMNYVSALRKGLGQVSVSVKGVKQEGEQRVTNCIHSATEATVICQLRAHTGNS